MAMRSCSFHHLGFYRDERAVEGFMEEIPAVAVITFAVTLFMISTVSATAMYLADLDRTEAMDRAKDVSAAVVSYGPLLVEERSGHLSAKALDDMATGKLQLKLANIGETRMTVREKTSTVSWEFGTTNRSDAADATVTRSVLVGHVSQDAGGGSSIVYRIAVLEVRTW